MKQVCGSTSKLIRLNMLIFSLISIIPFDTFAAQTSVNYLIDKNVLDCGGGDDSSTNFRNSASIGQLSGVDQVSTSYTMASGFQAGQVVPPTISGTPSTTSAVGIAYSFTPTATNAYRFSITGGMPPGLNFNTTTGALSGTPTTVGTYGNIIITATNVGGSVSLPAFSITFHANQYTLSVSVTGSGSVHGSDLSSAIGIPGNIACSDNTGVCGALYPDGDTINLYATATGATNIFGGWGGACTSTISPCGVAMNGDQNVTANFIQAPLAKNSTTGVSYAMLADALAAANSTTPEVLLLISASYAGPLVLSKAITLYGGWDAMYQGQTGLNTTVNDSLTVNGGSSGLEYINIFGKLTVAKGPLRVRAVKVR